MITRHRSRVPGMPPPPFSFLRRLRAAPSRSLFPHYSSPQRFADSGCCNQRGTVNTSDVGPSCSRDRRAHHPVFSLRPSLSLFLSPIGRIPDKFPSPELFRPRRENMRRARGAVNKCAISLQGIMRGSQLSKHRGSRVQRELLDNYFRLHLQRDVYVHKNFFLSICT